MEHAETENRHAILIVEGDEAARHNLCCLLRDQGYQPVPVTSM